MPNLSPSENPNSEFPVKVDLAIIARDLKLSPENVEKAVQLLDDGNTIPFITRFRKDHTGGLNERQILTIKQMIAQHRAMAERKSFVLKSIESQEKLTDELRQAIQSASSARRLEDIYLPYKPRKQSRALTARQQGLDPLAEDVFTAENADLDLASRATDFVRVDKGLNNVDDVIRGVSDLLVERFGENGELRSSLRQIMWNTGRLIAQVVTDPDSENKSNPENSEGSIVKKSKLPKSDSSESEKLTATANSGSVVAPLKASSDSDSDSEISEEVKTEIATEVTTEASAGPQQAATADSCSTELPQPAATSQDASIPLESPKPTGDPAPVTPASSDSPALPVVESPVADNSVSAATVDTTSKLPAGETAAPTPALPKNKKKKKKKKKKVAADPFKDYHDFKQPLKNIPNHRVLAINRGERADKLRVRVESSDPKLIETALAPLVPENHPFSEFLKKCLLEAVSKILLPSLEREIRRELTETAEKHAVEVFANNLRNLLLQPPMRNIRVLAIDPGFKSGCAAAVLDAFGNLIDSGHVFVVGNQSRRDESKKRLFEWVKQHSVDIIAIGTGAACRQAEQLVSDTISEFLTDHAVRYVMVNEAGASIYSTSEIGREELPDIAPSIRSAVSIGRRLQDPLSELVKISPANIGVGMYQHDVKAKHLSESLDDVVEACVNQVGVNVNTASPSLLKYVSGLNALTARRLVEHRQEINGFKSRQQLKEVSGIGDTTFIQSAGFLRVRGGDNPLDSTSIHPESYSLAENIIQRVDSTPAELFPNEPDLIPTAVAKANLAPVAASESAPVALAASEPANSEPVVSESTSAETTVESALVESALVEIAPVESAPVESAPVESAPVESAPVADASAEEIPAKGEEDDPAAVDLSSMKTENPVSSEIASDTVPPATTLASSETPQAETLGLASMRKQIAEQINKLQIDQIAADYSAGKMLVRDILLALKKPDWDPRDRTHKPIFRRGIIKVDDLKPEMQLDGQIVNVVDFGVFVDIGLGESSLVHVSQLSNQYVRDPHRFCAVGDVLRVWVSEIDTERRRVKLTAIQPGSKSPNPSRRKHSGDSTDKSTGAGSSQGKRYERSSKPGSRRDPKRTGGAPSGQQRDSRRVRTDRPKSHRPNKPAPPITDKMLKGDEPMRSFSDLLQFVKKKPEKDDEKS